MAEKMNRDIIIVHTSDLHVDHDYTARLHGGDGTAGLACVLQASRSIGADVVLLVGDTFDSHRVPDHVLDRAAAVISDSGLPVVLLPGNHDQAIEFPELGLEVWGRPHLDYGDMVPFEIVRARRTRWQVAVAHGHYDPQGDRSISPRASWLINDEELVATGADYVALGHWNRAVRVGGEGVAAYYSGSPEYAGTVNVVRLAASGEVVVTLHELDIAREVEPVFVP